MYPNLKRPAEYPCSQVTFGRLDFPNLISAVGQQVFCGHGNTILIGSHRENNFPRGIPLTQHQHIVNAAVHKLKHRTLKCSSALRPVLVNLVVPLFHPHTTADHIILDRFFRCLVALNFAILPDGKGLLDHAGVEITSRGRFLNNLIAAKGKQVF